MEGIAFRRILVCSPVTLNVMSEKSFRLLGHVSSYLCGNELANQVCVARSVLLRYIDPIALTSMGSVNLDSVKTAFRGHLGAVNKLLHCVSDVRQSHFAGFLQHLPSTAANRSVRRDMIKFKLN